MIIVHFSAPGQMRPLNGYGNPSMGGGGGGMMQPMMTPGSSQSMPIPSPSGGGGTGPQVVSTLSNSLYGYCRRWHTV